VDLDCAHHARQVSKVNAKPGFGRISHLRFPIGLLRSPGEGADGIGSWGVPQLYHGRTERPAAQCRRRRHTRCNTRRRAYAQTLRRGQAARISRCLLPALEFGGLHIHARTHEEVESRGDAEPQTSWSVAAAAERRNRGQLTWQRPIARSERPPRKRGREIRRHLLRGL
jgi:hypothetical protein